jgi:hypothetical protein
MVNWSLYIMADNENQVSQQVEDKIKFYNRQRAGLAIVIVVFIGILVFSMAAGGEALPVRLSAFCSVVLLLCNAVFVLSFRGSLLLLLTATSITAALFVLKQIRFELFLILLLINAGTIFISSKTAQAIIRSFTNEKNKIKRLETEGQINAAS